MRLLISRKSGIHGLNLVEAAYHLYEPLEAALCSLHSLLGPDWDKGCGDKGLGISRLGVGAEGVQDQSFGALGFQIAKIKDEGFKVRGC